MPEKPKTWIGLSAALLVSASLVTATLVSATLVTAPPAAAAGLVQLAAGESGDTDEDAEFLMRLGVLRGQVDVAVELYRIGQQAAAAANILHAEKTLYAALEPALEARAMPAFKDHLEALADAVETKAPADEVEDNHAIVLTALSEAEAIVATPSPYEIGKVITKLARHAAEEYGEAVAGGKIVKAAAYQEAFGCLRVAADWQTDLAAISDDGKSVAAIGQQLDLMRPALPSAVPPTKVSVDPSVLSGAAARIEIATLKLKK